jgi:hypothetical protein
MKTRSKNRNLQTLAALGIVMTALGSAASTACSDPFSTCEARQTCPAEEDGGTGGTNLTGGRSNGGSAGKLEGGDGTAGVPGSSGAGAASSTGEGQGGSAEDYGIGGGAGDPLGGTASGAVGGLGGDGGSAAGQGLGANSGGGGEPSAGSGGTPLPTTCEPGTKATCGTVFGSKGQCGLRVVTCTADGEWPSAANACDAGRRDCSSPLDNDCDGLPDEVLDDVCRCTPGALEVCNEHPGLDGIGRCTAGERICEQASDRASSTWSRCLGYADPHPETCNNARDDDCNLLVDDGCSCEDGETEACGMCGNGTQECVSGAWGRCTETLAQCPSCPTTCGPVITTQALRGSCCVCDGMLGTFEYAVPPPEGTRYMFLCRYPGDAGE